MFLFLLAAPVTAQSGVKLGDLAEALSGGPTYMQADFAWSAVYEMSLAFAEEAGDGRADLARHKNKRDLRRWTRNIQDYAEHLATIAEAITIDTPVSVGRDGGGQVQLVIAGRPIIVSGPRISEPGALEKRIIARFCGLHPCDAFRPAVARSEPAVASRPRRRTVSTEWRFDGRGGALCVAANGIELRFADTDGLAAKRRWCRDLAVELEALAQRLAELSANTLDWKALAVLDDDGIRTLVHLNKDGDYFEQYLPLLAADPRLLTRSHSWLRTRVKDKDAPARLRIDRAGRFMLWPQ